MIYKIVSADRSGTSLELAEFRMGLNQNYRVRYTIAKDGQSMTREYDGHDGALRLRSGQAWPSILDNQALLMSSFGGARAVAPAAAGRSCYSR